MKHSKLSGSRREQARRIGLSAKKHLFTMGYTQRTAAECLGMNSRVLSSNLNAEHINFETLTKCLALGPAKPMYARPVVGLELKSLRKSQERSR